MSSKSQEKEIKLKKIRDEIWNLKQSSLYNFRIKNKYYPVIGEGSHDAKLMLVGEAPGFNEAKTGRPFCGAAGKFLDELFDLINIKRSDAYVTNIVKDRPPGNRDPSPAEISLYGPFLEKQIQIIQPEIIMGLGRFSSYYIMNIFGIGDQMQSISISHGKKYEAWANYGIITVIPLYHPAVALYKPEMKKTCLMIFKL